MKSITLAIFAFVALTWLLCAQVSLSSRLITCDNGYAGDNCIWTADHLVVGTGPGGAPPLRLLSDDYQYSVIGFEAGLNYDDDPIISQGQNVLAIGTYGEKYNWALKDAEGFQMAVGRMTGGSSSHNGMQFTHVSAKYAQILESYGGSKWSAAAIAIASKQMENYTVAEGTIPSSRGTNGYTKVRKPATGPTSGANSMAFKLANWISAMSGFPINPDYNDRTRSPYGPFTRYQLAQDTNGVRSSAWTAYLPRSVLQKNGRAVGNRQLRVLFGANVTRIIFQGTTARGLVFRYNGVERVAWARKSIIIAGSVFTSKLLQLSGVGPASLLASKGINVVVNNPNVGSHVSNHASIFLPFAANTTEFPGLFPNDPALLYAGGAYMPSWSASGAVPSNGTRNFQIGWFPNMFPGTPLILFVSHLRTVSTGTERIVSSDPYAAPFHDDNVLSDPRDVNEFASFLYYAIQNMSDYMHSQDPSYRLNLDAWGLPPRWNSLDEAKAYLMSSFSKAYHYNGQCRMSKTPATGVVDSSLKVWGTKNLYISGSPVFPEVVDATLAGPTTLIGHMFSQIHIQERTYSNIMGFDNDDDDEDDDNHGGDDDNDNDW